MKIPRHKHKGKIVVYPAQRGYSTITQADLYSTFENIISVFKLDVSITKKAVKDGGFVTYFTAISPIELVHFHKAIRRTYGDRIEKTTFKCKRRWFY